MIRQSLKHIAYIAYHNIPTDCHFFPCIFVGEQLLTNKNTWEKVTVGRDVVICNIGDMLQRLTNHVLPSTTHRVTATIEESKNSRFSIPFFVHPNPDWYIQTLSNCVSEKNKNKYPEGILAEDYLKERLKEINLA